MRDDTDTQDDRSFPQADRPTDDRDRVATPAAEQAEPVADEPSDPTPRFADGRSTDHEADASADSAADPTPGSDLRSDEDIESPAAAPLIDEPTAASDDEGSAELMPGEVPAEPAAAGWAEGATETMRARWQELQLRFVDDPRGVAGEARSLVGEAVQAVTDALADQQRRLDSWSSAEGGDTEQLRVVVQQYRDFFDRVLDRAV